MKKILVLFLLFTCMMTLTACQSTAANSGSCGEDVKWAFYQHKISNVSSITSETDIIDKNVLVISGKGLMKEYYTDVWYSPDNVLIPWHFYSQQANKIVVEEGVESIGSFAFIDAKLCTEIEIADSVTYIGNCAFEHMNSLEKIILSKSVKTLGSLVFHSGYYDVFYEGSRLQFENIRKINVDGFAWDSEFYGEVYYYSEEQPTLSGNYWHYVDGEVVIWK